MIGALIHLPQKTVNQSQIKYVREVLSRKRCSLIERYAKSIEPMEVKEARKVIEAWREQNSELYARIRPQVEDAISEVEMKLIMADNMPAIKEALAELDSWKPSTT